MRFVLALLLFWNAGSFAITTDYDCIVIGTSPMCMLEALYQYHSGQRVLLIDAADTCGGAWKSINICGLSNVDMGCHEIGCQKEVKQFLEDYVGCKLMSLDNPKHEYVESPDPNSKGFYPAHGCHELIQNLTKLIQATSITVLLGHQLESVYLDVDNYCATVKINDHNVTTAKIIASLASRIFIENFPDVTLTEDPASTKHYHLYLLVEDPTPPRFTYEDDLLEGISRGANLSWFIGLEEKGLQLVVIQTLDEEGLAKGEHYLQALKDKNLLDPHAHILQTHTYIYEQCHLNPKSFQDLGPAAESVFDILDSWNFGCFPAYINKWKTVLKPYHDALNLIN